MASIDNYNLAENIEFRNKVDSIMRKVAADVKGEAPTALLSQQMVDKRAAFADKILWDSNRSVEYMMSKAIVSMGTLTESSNDSDIEYMITQLYNDLAGVNDSDWGTPFNRVRYMAIYDQADTLTIQLLLSVGIINLVPSKLAGYKTAIQDATDFETVSDLQTLLNAV